MKTKFSKLYDRIIYDNKYMEVAIKEARKSESQGGIPIGSTIVKDNIIIGRSHNTRVQEGNALFHAEINCIQKAIKREKDIRGTTIYTTCMPCYLCAGAIIQFGISKVVSGESKTFPHARHLLESNSVEVIDLDLEGCKKMLGRFILRNASLWHGFSTNNSPSKGNNKEEIIIPYKKQKYINFYQYPPPVRISERKKSSFKNKLALREKKDGGKFTLFISVPYCRSRCNSCPFFKNLVPSDNKVPQDYTQTLLKQIKDYADTARFSNGKCVSIYFGGGTASLLSTQQLDVLLKTIKKYFNVIDNAEITLEGNPVDFNKRYLIAAKSSGFNRVSIGVQSFHDKILKKILNSPHDSKIALNSIRNALVADLNTVNVDLLYGVPTQKEKDWLKSLEVTSSLSPQSVTLYHYIIHSGSKLERMIKDNLVERQANEEEIHKLYTQAYRKLKGLGYFEGRFGCFSKPGHEQQYSRMSYNLSCESIGIGAGAYSFINNYIFKASADIKKFQNEIEKDSFRAIDYMSPQATLKNQEERYIINNLFSGRLDRKHFKDIFGLDPLKIFTHAWAKLLRYNLIEVSKQYIEVTALGKRYIKNTLYEFYSKKFV